SPPTVTPSSDAPRPHRRRPRDRGRLGAELRHVEGRRAPWAVAGPRGRRPPRGVRRGRAPSPRPSAPPHVPAAAPPRERTAGDPSDRGSDVNAALPADALLPTSAPP